MAPPWPATVDGGKPGSSLAVTVPTAVPMASADGPHPEPNTRATSCSGTPTATANASAAASARVYGSTGSAMRHRRATIGPVGRSLSRTEVEQFDHLAPDVARRARLHRVRLLPPGAHGMTIGRHVLLLRGYEDRPTLIAHELVHVRQYAERGRLRFLARYLWDYVGNLVRLRNHRKAYLAIPTEVEARAEAKRWATAHPDA